MWSFIDAKRISTKKINIPKHYAPIIDNISDENIIIFRRTRGIYYGSIQKVHTNGKYLVSLIKLENNEFIILRNNKH